MGLRKLTDKPLERPRTDEQVAQLRDKLSKQDGIEKYTCDDCPAVKTCGEAFDAYNTHGDCLAEK